jgi:hypothetical protein
MEEKMTRRREAECDEYAVVIKEARELGVVGMS